MFSKQKQKIAIMQMLICAFLWSIAGIFIKLIDWNPFVIAGFRSLFAAVVVIVYMFATKQKIIISKNVLTSMFFLSATFLCFVSANKLTTAANAIVLQFTAPIFIMVFSALFFRQKFKFSDIIIVLLTFGGISIFFIGSLHEGQILGNIIGIFAGVFMAGMYISVSKTNEKEKMSGILFGHLLTAFIGIPFCFFTTGTISVVSVSSIIILGVVQLGIPYIIFGLASANCPPLACCLIAAAEPLLNPVWVWIFDGERPGMYSIIGGIIVITAVTVQCVLQDKHTMVQ
ncbi:MAG: DMT family transporter, partial [Acetobacterium sp.]|nr:DMT family transporter [Acetobacterium sp.]